MEEFLGLNTWGIQFSQWAQSWSNSFLDSLLVAITLLGNEEAYLVLLPLLYWSINKQWGQRLFFLVLLSTWLNEGLKNLFALPRPDPTVIQHKIEAVGYGFPSNHAQTGAVVVWGYLAAHVRRRWFTVLAVIMMLLIGLSRIVLGVHFLQDVLGGWLLGLLVLLVALRVEEPLVAWLSRLSLKGQVAIAIVLPILVLVTIPSDTMGRYPSEFAGTLSGVLLGAGLGSILEARTVNFRTEGTVVRRLLRYIAGMVLVSILYLGGAAVPDLSPWLLDVMLRVLRYALVSLTAFWIAPWLFVRLGLASTGLRTN
jgi:membrane-associated phospholipid phosphatase